MALVCVLGYCSDEKQKCGVREYGTGVCVCLVTAVTKKQRKETMSYTSVRNQNYRKESRSPYKFTIGCDH